MSRRDPAWRDRGAAALAAGSLSYLGLEGPVLVMLDHRPEVPEALDRLGLARERWFRRALGGAPAAPWPPDGPFGAVLLRLPKAKQEQEMSLHAGLARLRVGGRLAVYGANDEGARSAAGLVESLLGEVHTVATGSRCRVVSAARPGEIQGLRGDRDDWRQTREPPADELSGPWVSYPGVFAHGRLDDGTALLLEHLPELPVGARVLDFGCGSGVVGAVARARGREIRVELLDADALALEAARANVPGAELLLADGPGFLRDRSYDAILANPPYHEGKAESARVLRELIREAPAILEPRGMLALVTQRRLPTEELLRGAFRRVSRLADRGPYRVWQARLRGP